MGDCRYCGKPAGFLKQAHKECEEREQERKRARESALQDLRVAVSKAITGKGALDALEARIRESKQQFGLADTDLTTVLVEGWEGALDGFLENGVLDPAEEEALLEFGTRFSLSQSALDRGGAFTRMVKAGVLRDILSGKVPERFSVSGALPVNLQKRESIVWVFTNAKYLEDRTRRHYVGGSMGGSVRVMKGVYLRASSFKGHPVDHTERVHVDTGMVVVTTKHIYFAGPKKSLRVPYTKIVSFVPFSDGVGIMRDAASAKPQFFVTGDGWFTYNLVTNLAQM